MIKIKCVDYIWMDGHGMLSKLLPVDCKANKDSFRHHIIIFYYTWIDELSMNLFMQLNRERTRSPTTYSTRTYPNKHAIK